MNDTLLNQYVKREEKTFEAAVDQDFRWHPKNM